MIENEILCCASQRCKTEVGVSALNSVLSPSNPGLFLRLEGPTLLITSWHPVLVMVMPMAAPEVSAFPGISQVLCSGNS